MKSLSDEPMIRNERQRRIARARAHAFGLALADLVENPPDLDPRLVQAVADGYRERIARLEEQLAEYEALRRGDTESIQLREVRSIGDALIAGRVARNWTQADLAQALGIPPQQVQRYEATRYEKASLTRAHDVASILGIKLEGAAVLAGADKDGARRKRRPPS
jgi:ribosome-binding protein aMBF1 (putative translation factor)